MLFWIITDLLMLTCSRYAILGVFLTCMWKIFITHDPHATQKASVGMLSLPLIHTNLVCILFGIHPSICDRIWENPLYGIFLEN